MSTGEKLKDSNLMFSLKGILQLGKDEAVYLPTEHAVNLCTLRGS
jgi:hypothetical protein